MPAAPRLDGETLTWDEPLAVSNNSAILRPASEPFSHEGGMKLVQGNLGRAIFKTSAVDDSRWTIEAPARVFADQDEVIAAFEAGELERDVAVVVRFQGPAANGMPELHKLTPPLGVLQDRGFKVMLLTDGRMSGASGKVPAAIHLSPEAARGGPIGKLRDGDQVRLCAHRGELSALVVRVAQWQARTIAFSAGLQRASSRDAELFAMMRHGVDGAEQGASAMLAMAGL